MVQPRQRYRARAYPVGDAQDHRPNLVENGRGLPPRGRGGLKRQVQKEVILKIATLNVGSMMGKRTEIVRLMKEKAIEIMCVQETRWKGRKSYEIGAGYKIIYYGEDNRRNGVGIILSPKVKERVWNVKRTSDCVMSVRLEVSGEL